MCMYFKVVTLKITAYSLGEDFRPSLRSHKASRSCHVGPPFTKKEQKSASMCKIPVLSAMFLPIVRMELGYRRDNEIFNYIVEVPKRFPLSSCHFSIPRAPSTHQPLFKRCLCNFNQYACGIVPDVLSTAITPFSNGAQDWTWPRLGNTPFSSTFLHCTFF